MANILCFVAVASISANLDKETEVKGQNRTQTERKSESKERKDIEKKKMHILKKRMEIVKGNILLSFSISGQSTSSVSFPSN